MMSRATKKKRSRCPIEIAQHIVGKRMLLLLLIAGPVAVASLPSAPIHVYGACDVVSLAGMLCGVFFAPAYGDNLNTHSDPFAPVINRYNGLTRRYSGSTFDFTQDRLVWEGGRAGVKRT